MSAWASTANNQIANATEAKNTNLSFKIILNPNKLPLAWQLNCATIKVNMADSRAVRNSQCWSLQTANGARSPKSEGVCRSTRVPRCYISETAADQSIRAGDTRTHRVQPSNAIHAGISIAGAVDSDKLSAWDDAQ